MGRRVRHSPGLSGVNLGGSRGDPVLGPQIGSQRPAFRSLRGACAVRGCLGAAVRAVPRADRHSQRPGDDWTPSAGPLGLSAGHRHGEYPRAASAQGQAGYSASRHTSQALQLQQPGHWQSPGPQSQQSKRRSHVTRHDSRNSHMADPIRDDEHGIVASSQADDSAGDMHGGITGHAASAAHHSARSIG